MEVLTTGLPGREIAKTLRIATQMKGATAGTDRRNPR